MAISKSNIHFLFKRLVFQFLIVLIAVLLFPAHVNAAETKTQTKQPDKTSSKDTGDNSKIARKIEEKYGLVTDEKINARVEKVSSRLLSALNENEKIKDKILIFKALKNDEINAFALPDGHIYLFKGLIDIAKTDDQLASVIAHELAHIIKKHSKLISKKATPYLVGGAIIALLTGEPAAAVAGEWIAGAQAESFERKAEEEADKYGLELLARAGYNPVGMLQFMGFMVEEEKRRPELFHNYFFVHPFADVRLETLKKLTREMGYKVPDSLYRSYLESGIASREENGVQLVDIKFGGETIVTIAGNDKKELEDRALRITSTLDSLLNEGTRDLDFTIAKDGDMSWIQAKGRILYEPTQTDIDNSTLGRDEFLKKILAKVKHLMWEERLKRRI